MEHWVTSSCVESHIHLYDSLYFGSISDPIARQLKETYSHLKMVQVMRVQQQQGAVDCGLFTVAYTVDPDPSKVKFAQDKLREHFANCLRKKLFPVEKTLSIVARPDVVHL